ncbi:MAG: flagellar hook assembly protein FlgD [Rhodoferax sp.]|uniref:flagellar hook assembly protein FlgD n=1 Tax=Rhodoferax sp. TaxID=50421 RepID=UPI002607FF2D|nr:flagellar hook assembly protein FlgD [Rhodoferax sp.]MDD5336108.1 flagellar hook assembly protein FlgD [Rhodoferax sp.]
MVSNVVNSSSVTSAASASATSASAGSEDRFLKLLVTQLNNQDPLNPLDNAQLTSQLAQMSTVSGIEKLNTALQSLLAQSGSSQVLQSAGLIGRSVLVPGQQLALQQGAAVPFAIEMPGAADAVKVDISDSAGHVVRSYDLGSLAAGVKTLSWDGKGTGDTALPDGVYKVSAAATGAGGNVIPVALTYANVTSVAQGANGIALTLADSRMVGFSDVRLIASAASSSL